MKTISRRNFVATTVVIGAGAVLRAPAFAFADLGASVSSGASSKAVKVVRETRIVGGNRGFKTRIATLIPGI